MHACRQRGRRLTVQTDVWKDKHVGRQADRRSGLNKSWAFDHDAQQADAVAYMEGDQDLEECCHVSKCLGPRWTTQAICQVGSHTITICPVACTLRHAIQCMRMSACRMLFAN